MKEGKEQILKIQKHKQDWYKNNKEKVLSKQRNYYLLNRQKVLVYKAKYYITNKERINKRDKKFYIVNRETILTRQKIFYQKTRLKHLIYAMEYHKKNRTARLIYGKNYYEKNKEKLADINFKKYHERKKLFEFLKTPALMQNHYMHKYNGHLFPQHEKRKCTQFLIDKWDKNYLHFGKESKVLRSKNWKPMHIQAAWVNENPLPPELS